MKLLLSPHNDDAALFASFTILRERPRVLTVLDCYKQKPEAGRAYAELRRSEDREAMKTLGAEINFLGLKDVNPDWDYFERHLAAHYGDARMVWAPLVEAGGHPHHNMVGEIAGRVFGDRVTFYATYTGEGKTKGFRVDFKPEWVALKLKALACYESQIGRFDNVDHFLREQFEYYA